MTEELTIRLRAALLRALASGLLEEKATLYAASFLVSGSIDISFDDLPRITEGNKALYWTIWSLYWWQYKRDSALESNIIELEQLLQSHECPATS